MGAFAPVMAAGIGAAANLAGGFMSAGSAAANNAQQLAMLNQQETFQNNVNNASWEHDQAMAQYNWNNQQLQNQYNWNAMDWSAANNAQQAATQMAFQRDMSSTAYQRTVADMLKAGINPILAYQQGGASTPMGAMGTSNMASGGTPSGQAHSLAGTSLGYSGQNTGAEVARGISNAVSSATEAAKTYAGVDLMQEQAKTQQKVRDKTEQDTHTSSAQETNAMADTVKKAEETRKAAAEADGQRIQNEIYKIQTGITAKQLENYNQYGSPTAPDTLERILRTVGGHMPPVPAVPSVGNPPAPGEPDRPNSIYIKPKVW